MAGGSPKSRSISAPSKWNHEAINVFLQIMFVSTWYDLGRNGQYSPIEEYQLNVTQNLWLSWV